MATPRLGQVRRHIGGPPRTEPAGVLSDDELARFRETGVHVVRGALSQSEVDTLSSPICHAFSSLNYDGFSPGAASYPVSGVYSMGPRVLDAHPEVALVSCAHAVVRSAVEQVLGEPATLAQFWSIMRPPGAGVAAGQSFIPGSGAHYDYKPWRCVGSFVRWVFAVIPFVDYTVDAGPLLAAPGSCNETTLLPSDGRLHQIDAAQVPTAELAAARLVDPQLKRGDVLIMHGFTWHEARPNHGKSDRVGLYMKFHAKSSPPACGPVIFPSAVAEVLPPEARHLVPYHRGGGRYAQVGVAGPVGGIDLARLLIEDQEGRVLLVRRYGLQQASVGGGATAASECWGLPMCAVTEDPAASILDVCNVIGATTGWAQMELGLKLPWLSWLLDLSVSGQNVQHARNEQADGRGGNREERRALGGDSGDSGDEQQQRRCRVFAHRLQRQQEQVQVGVVHHWIAGTELARGSAATLPLELPLECAGQEAEWLKMWTKQLDEIGRPVSRSFGFATSPGQASFKYNSANNPSGHYRIGVFDAAGEIPEPPAKLGLAYDSAGPSFAAG